MLFRMTYCGSNLKVTKNHNNIKDGRTKLSFQRLITVFLDHIRAQKRRVYIRTKLNLKKFNFLLAV